MVISSGAILLPLYGAILGTKKNKLICIGINEVSVLIALASFGYWIFLPNYLIIFYDVFWRHNLGVKK